MKRRQTVRRLEIVAVVAVVAVSLGVGFYLALKAGYNDPVNGTTVPASVYNALYQTSETPYGTTNSAYLSDIHSMSGSPLVTNGKPILVYVGAEYCPYCAVTRWSLVMALMRFGNFTNLEYWTSGEDNFATFTFVASSYQSKYVVFQPYEVEDNAGNPLATLPANYTSAWQQYGKSAFPFVNFADEYYLAGAILDPGILGRSNQTQIISSIQAGNSVGSEIKQAANVITAAICETTGDSPSSVCGQPSITGITLVSYTLPSTGSGSELLLAGASFTTSPGAFITGRDYSGWS
jgi:thiol-disulfide isomerase/thioredoxin